MASEKGGRKDKNQNIQVFVRLRPLNQRERDIKSLGVVEVVNNREVVVRQSQQTSHTKRFTFDRAFGPHAKQLEIYQDVVSPLIEEVLSGYNCTVFAYGQTGTGKTHTMVGEHTGEGTNWQNDPLAGIIPRALSQLFDELRLSNTEYTVRVSYLELYNEELFDLLSTSEDNSKLRIYEDVTRKGSNIVNGLEEITVYNKSEVYKIMSQGQERKRVASTLMNAQSSRSHTVFTIVVHMKENSPEGEELVKIGKLNLVDLAGSENISKAGSDNPAKRERARECVNINQSLLTLGRVITALVERHPHIPYRESKLTRILQESLGGRTKTSIIATVSPGHKDLEETMSTLEYAHRAKNIQNKPEINQKMTKKAILKEYAEEIDRLKRDLMAARDKNGVYLASETFAEITLKQEEQRKEIQELLLHKRAMEEKRDQLHGLFEDLNRQLDLERRRLQDERERLEAAERQLKDTSQELQSTQQKCEEQCELTARHADTEARLGEQARRLLHVADTASSHAARLHSTVDRRRSVEAANLQLTQYYREQSAAERERALADLGAGAALLADTFDDLRRGLEAHSEECIQGNQQNIEIVQELAQKLEEATNEMKALRSSTHAALSARGDRQRAQLRASLRQRTESAHGLLSALVRATVGVLVRARGEGGSGRAALEEFLNSWLSSSRGHSAALRERQTRALAGWRAALEAGRLAARRRHEARLQRAGTRARAARACTEEIAAEQTLLEQRIARQRADVEAERRESDQRLNRWVEDERRAFEERLARHVADQRRMLEDRLTKKAAEIAEEERLHQASLAKRLSWHEDQLKCTDEDLEFESTALGDQEAEVDETGRRVDEFGVEFDEAAANIASSSEAVSSAALEALSQAHSTLLRALEEASASIESGVTNLIQDDQQNTQKLTEETDAVLGELLQSSKQAMDTIVESIESANSRTAAGLGALSAGSGRLVAAAHEQRSAGTGRAAAGRAAAESVCAALAASVAALAALQERCLGTEYAVYTPSGETPVRQQFQYPRQLAATSPHERILARFRAARLQTAADDDCMVVESEEPPASNSDSECSEDSAVFAAPSPPSPRPPRPPRRAPLALVKSTSETDIYTLKKQQGKENTEQSITSSLKKPSKLPAPTSHKKPLAERNAVS